MNSSTILRQFKRKEGWLEKKSPSIIVGFQKRYFSFCEDKNSIYLLYDKKPPQKDKKPKGAIQLSLIQDIISKEGSLEFILKFGQRDFILRASTVADKKQWIETCEYLKQYSLDLQQESTDQVDQSALNKKDGWRFKKLDANSQRDLVLNLEKKNLDEDDVKDIELKDEQMQRLKGMYDYFSRYSEDIQNNHIVQGCLYKKKQKLSHVASTSKKRWFIIFSEFPLIDNVSQDVNDFNINDLPPFMNSNVLYHYDTENNESTALGHIHVKNITSIHKIDLKVEGDNILKKGFDKFGNQVVSAVNKFTEVTKLDKIGAKIQRFEYQFEITSSKEGKEVTFLYSSESLIQIEKWILLLNKIVDAYKLKEKSKKAQEELLLQQQKQKLAQIEKQKQQQQKLSKEKEDQSQSNESEEQSETEQPSDQQQENQQQNKKSLEQEQEVESENENETPLPQTLNPQNLVSDRDQVIIKSEIFTKSERKLRIGWCDRIGTIKRQIIQIYKEEKDIDDQEVEIFITIKDISSIDVEKSDCKLIITKNNKEQRRLKFKSNKIRNAWFQIVRALIDDEQTPIVQLRQLEEGINQQSSQISHITINNESKNIDSINEAHKRSTYSEQGESKQSSFSNVDRMFYKAYQESQQSQIIEEEQKQKQKKKKSCCSFLCCCCCCCEDNDDDGIDEQEDKIKSKPGKKQLLS